MFKWFFLVRVFFSFFYLFDSSPHLSQLNMRMLGIYENERNIIQQWLMKILETWHNQRFTSFRFFSSFLFYARWKKTWWSNRFLHVNFADDEWIRSAFFPFISTKWKNITKHKLFLFFFSSSSSEVQFSCMTE